LSSVQANFIEWEYDGEMKKPSQKVLKGDTMKRWQAHRLEGKVKNRGIKKVKKPKRV